MLQHNPPQAELCFQKQPIQSRCSLNSAISSVIPPPRVTSLTHRLGQDSQEPKEKCSLDWNQQIRAPRMSVKLQPRTPPIAQHAHLGNCDFLNNKESSSSTFSRPPVSDTAETSPMEEPQIHRKEYTPACFDLQHSLHSISPTCNSFSIPQGEKLKALQNLDSNTTSFEKSRPKSRNGPLKQMNDPKTPNYVPAVLRPPQQLGESNTSPKKAPSVQSLTSLEGAGLSLAEKCAFEPTHSHWVPNNERMNCASCGVKFSLVLRKHHCRSCGDIFCYNCYGEGVFQRFSGDLSGRAKLNDEANFDLEKGINCKVCVCCERKWIEFSKYGTSSHPDDTDRNENSERDLSDRKGSAVAVPSDWTWSSF